MIRFSSSSTRLDTLLGHQFRSVKATNLVALLIVLDFGYSVYNVLDSLVVVDICEEKKTCSRAGLYN
jgi:hypothetical protein